MRDRFDVDHPERGLDQHLDTDAVRNPARGFDLRQQRVGEIHVARCADLGDEQGVESVAGLLDHVHHVAIEVVRVDAVDPHGDRLAALAPAVLQQRRHHVAARLLLVGRGDRVLEVQKHVIRLALQRLPEQRGLRARDGQLAALQPGAGRLVARQTHVATLAREGLAPGAGCWASGDGAAASGAALLR